MHSFSVWRASRLALCLISTSLTLSSCKTIENANQRIAGQTQETIAGRFIDVAPQYRLSGPPSKKEEQALNDAPRTIEQKRLPGSEPLEAYAGEVLMKLMASYSGYKPPMRVVITTSSALTASAIASGDIMIPQGILLNVDSEDEFAFVLAHEASHLLLNHHADEPEQKDWEALQEVRKQTSSIAAMLANLTPQGAAKTNTVLARTQQIFTLADEANELLLAPAWKRTQEDLADILAVDIMTKAGYNRSTALRLMQRMDDQDQKLRAEKAADRTKTDTQIGNHFAQGQFNQGLNLILNSVVALPQTALKDLGDDLRREHGTAADREENLSGYLDRAYASEPLPMRLETARFEQRVFTGAALRSLNRQVLSNRADTMLQKGRYDEAIQWIELLLSGPKDTSPDLRLKLFRVHLAAGNRPKAIEQLELAVKDRAASEEVFLLLMTAYREDGQFQKSLATLDAFGQRFPEQRDETLPERVRLLKSLKRDGEARQTAERCQRLTKRPDLVQRCQLNLEVSL